MSVILQKVLNFLLASIVLVLKLKLVKAGDFKLLMWKKLNSLLVYITESGIEDRLKLGAVKSIKMVNQLSLVCGLISLFLFFQGYSLKPGYVRITELLSPLIFISIPFISRFGFYIQARYIFYLALNMYCFVSASALGMGSGRYLLFIPIIAATALVVNFRRRKYVIQALSITLTPILILLCLNDSLAIDQQMHRELLEEMNRQNFIVTIVLSFLVAYFYYRITYKQELMLRDLLQKQSELNVELRRKEKKLEQNLLYSDGLAARLKESKDYFKSLLQNASDITSVVDGRGRFKYITPSFFRFTGFKPEDIVNKTVFDFIYPDDLEEATERFRLNVSNSPRPDVFRFRYLKADGGFLYLEAKGTNLLNDANVGGIVINARNVTDRLYYEQEASTKEKNIRSILDNNDICIWLIDKEHRLIDFNTLFARDFAERFGIELRRDMILIKFLPGAEQEKWQVRYEDAFRGIRKSYTDTYMVGEEERSFLITLFPIVDGDEVERVTAFSKDITEQEKARKALIEAKEKAEEATQVKTQFLSTMSHELRTPMNAVIGTSRLLIEENTDPEQAEKLRILKFSAENLLVLINDILDFSKIEAGKIQFEQVPFGLAQLVSDIRNLMLPAAKEKEIRLELLQDPNLPQKLIGDPLRLSQVLTNLLSNAVKFTQQGEVKIKVSLLRDAAHYCLVEFSVQDTGIGIPANMQEAVFDRFTQASSDTSRRFGGTGLGLAICKRLLELQGSKIMLESQEGKGSTFSFRLQFEKENLHNNYAMQQSGEGDEFLRGRRILMVEDNPLNVFVGVKSLEKWGIEVATAESGREALIMLKEQVFDLVLMDLQMPEMDGFEATRRIRQLEEPQAAGLPVLAISAASEQEVKEKALEAGMNGFILKPFNLEELYKKLVHYLQQGTAAVKTV